MTYTKETIFKSLCPNFAGSGMLYPIGGKNVLIERKDIERVIQEAFDKLHANTDVPTT